MFYALGGGKLLNERARFLDASTASRRTRTSVQIVLSFIVDALGRGKLLNEQVLNVRVSFY